MIGWLALWILAAVLATHALGQTGLVVQVARPVKDFSVPDLNGQPIRLSKLEAPALLVVFCATWDTHSQKHLPVLAELQQEFGPTNLVVLAIALDEGGAARVRSYNERNPLPVRWATATPEAVQAFGDLNAIPTTYLLDRRLNLIQRYVGRPEKELIAAAIRAVLAAAQ